MPTAPHACVECVCIKGSLPTGFHTGPELSCCLPASPTPAPSQAPMPRWCWTLPLSMLNPVAKPETKACCVARPPMARATALPAPAAARPFYWCLMCRRLRAGSCLCTQRKCSRECCAWGTRCGGCEMLLGHGLRVGGCCTAGVGLCAGCTAGMGLHVGCTAGVGLYVGCTAGVELHVGCTAGVGPCGWDYVCG